MSTPSSAATPPPPWPTSSPPSRPDGVLFASVLGASAPKTDAKTPTSGGGGCFEGAPDEDLGQMAAVVDAGVQVGRRVGALIGLGGGLGRGRTTAEGGLGGRGPQRAG